MSLLEALGYDLQDPAVIEAQTRALTDALKEDAIHEGEKP